MKSLSNSDYRNILSKLLIKSLSNPEPAQEIVEQALDDNDFLEQVKLLCEAYLKPEYMSSKLIAKSVPIRALESLVAICKREKLGILPIDFNGDEEKPYAQDEQICILVLSGQISLINQAILEAMAVSGAAEEIKRSAAESFIKKINDSNAMLEIQNVRPDTYRTMKEQVKRLPYEMRFTMFPKENEKGMIDVGFLTSTRPVTMKRKSSVVKEGPYLIPKMASVLLASSLLESPEVGEEYRKEKKKEERFIQEINDLYFSWEGTYYLVPANNEKDGVKIFPDLAMEVNFYQAESSFDDMKEFVEANFAGLNHLVLPMTQEEFELYKDETSLEPDALEFMEDKTLPEPVTGTAMKETQIAESFIDMLNRKREEILLASDDFDGNNLSNLESYAAVSVHELIVREDEDYSQWTEKDEERDQIETNLIEDLKKNYPVVPAYGDHDKVTELINNERAELEGSRSSKEYDEIDR